MRLQINFQSPTLKKVNHANLPSAGFLLSQGSQGKSENLLEDQRKSGKLEIFWKKSGRSQVRKFLSMQFFNFRKKTICMQKCVQLNFI